MGGEGGVRCGMGNKGSGRRRFILTGPITGKKF